MNKSHKIPALTIRHLSKRYPNGVEAVKNISLDVESGDFFALLGANGAGKSTTIGMITTLLDKTSGQVLINGYDLDKERTLAKSQIGLVPQEFNLNIFENPQDIILNQAGYYGISRKKAFPLMEQLLEQLDLSDKRLHQIRELSGGMKRRVMIARSLIHQPSVLILDEPTAGVDIEIRRSMWDFLTMLNKQGTTIILTTHYLEEAEQLCRHVAIINKGEIIEHGSMSELLKSLKHQTFVFNTAEEIDTLPDLTPYEAIKIEKNCFELRVDENTSLNDIFDKLTRQNIRISSMRNKTNRLEELFMDLIKHD